MQTTKEDAAKALIDMSNLIELVDSTLGKIGYEFLPPLKEEVRLEITSEGVTELILKDGEE